MTAYPADATVASEPTFIDFLLDETGSMQSCHGATVTGFNSFLAEQREVGGDCFFTLSKFDSSGIKTPYQNLRLESVPDLSFFPRASTNLFDAVGGRVTEILSQDRQGRSLVVVLTDGDENASQTFRTAAQVKEQVDQALAKGVNFLFFGAGPRSKSQALAMGFPESTISIFDTREMGATMMNASAQTRAFRVGA